MMTSRLQYDLNELYEHSDKSIQVDNCLNHIVKELEILEILEKHIKLFDLRKYGVYNFGIEQNCVSMNEQDFYKIKEWLENE